MSSSVRMSVLFGIRDARGLTEQEKAFLFVVETRGVMKSGWEKAAADMGMGKNKFYAARASLKAKGLIEVWPQDNATTWYSVDADALADYLEDSHSGNASHSGNEDSHNQNGDSHSGNGHSHYGEQKETTKVTEKVTTKTGDRFASGKTGKTDMTDNPSNDALAADIRRLVPGADVSGYDVDPATYDEVLDYWQQLAADMAERPDGDEFRDVGAYADYLKRHREERRRFVAHGA